MESNFCAFILTHARPGNVRTYATLKKHGYDGPIYLLVDNEDKTIEEYRRIYGDKVIVFDKKEVSMTFDEADNFNDRKAIVYARNSCFEIAKKLGYKYFIQLDDDYTSFLYRNNDGGKNIKNINKVFELFIEFLECSPQISTVAFSQGGDHIGGYDDTKKIKRKAMNSFFCSVEKEFKFLGRINEDVNTYLYLGGLGNIFFTIMNIQLNQLATQSNTGGMTDLYLNTGTYVKSFYSIIFNPSAVVINTMGRSSRRLHHAISWDNSVPVIVDEKYRKNV